MSIQILTVIMFVSAGVAVYSLMERKWDSMGFAIFFLFAAGAGLAFKLMPFISAP